MTRVDERNALLFGLGAVLLWSTVATAFKLGLRELAPVQLLLLGSVVSLGFFTAWAWFRGHLPALLALRGRALANTCLLGLLNPFLYYLVLFEAYARLPAQIAQPLNYTWAVTLALMAVPLLGQRLRQRDVVGIAISYAGVLVLLSGGRFEGFAALDPIGILLALGSTVIWAGYWLLSVRSREHAVVTMTGGFFVGTAAIGVVCGLTAGWPVLNLEHLAYGCWVGLVEMGITFLLWREALARTAFAARIGQLVFLSPFLSFVLIGRVLGETIQVSSVLGLAGIVGGLVIARR